ncbi:MAG: hypothetical protein KGM18_03140 [Sphingomonadales bacterium]|nr:hypothetical protein [Sphingomonadales bacterium]
MEFAIDLMTSLRDRLDPRGGAAAEGVIDWFSLQTRFAAAHAARRELARIDSGKTLQPGGFAHWASQPDAAGHGSPVINPNDLADRKGPASKDGAVAENAPCPGRG